MDSGAWDAWRLMPLTWAWIAWIGVSYEVGDTVTYSEE